MPWPDYIRDMFDAIPGGLNDATDESLFYGPYCNLLLYLFPPTEKYMITPQFKRPPEGWAIDFVTIFVVQKAFHPVFFLEVKPPGHYALRSTRAAADDQMRKRFFDLADVVELPVIHGVSALGTRLCFYEYTRNNDLLIPYCKPSNDNHMNDVAPAARWNYDVLSEEGVAKMTQVANEVKAMVAQHAWLLDPETLQVLQMNV
ncbi:hypothetical protein CVT26_012327 [Gymnopilus dilepis]|uniref:Fungal-type protein kinase domain-containing protein n=1 Tax=Gymnopilus dilepis TaxID=231916 RepID=A0A409YCG1_9AGAR|nr:hypothetical protein CVT26_012327 [Gymnopilus dilepis]